MKAINIYTIYFMIYILAGSMRMKMAMYT